MSHTDFHDLLNRIEAMSPDQMCQLRHELDHRLASSPATGPQALTAEELADQEAQRRLLAAGVIAEIKPSRRIPTGTVHSAPIPIEGEPLSETVIRARR